MKLFRYRKPSVKTLLGITRIERKIKKATGISTIERFTKPSRIKQTLKQKVGIYSPEMTIIRQTAKGKFPTLLGFSQKKRKENSQVSRNDTNIANKSFTLNLKPQKNVESCTSQFMAKESPEKIKEHYSFMFNSSVGAYNGYIKSGVVIGKEWLAGNGKDVCDVCRKNQEAGAIPLTAKFPSGHLFPPAGQMCRCSLQPVVD